MKKEFTRFIKEVFYFSHFFKIKKLAEFLADIQCKDDLPCVNGGWRGSYNLKTGRYDGRCNQLNALDEGGEYSVYAGWCALPIAFGMLKLL